MIPYELVRSNRGTVSLSIGPQGQVLVRAPRRCPRAYIEQFLLSKQRWIARHQQTVLNTLAQRETFSLQAGDQLPFCGRTLTVDLQPGNTVQLDLDAGRLTMPQGRFADQRPQLLKLYRRAGAGYLRDRLNHWAGVMGISYGNLRLSSAVTRWGSCSSAGNISISVFSLFATAPCIDYILVHELSHIREFNHSDRFWSIVAAALPDYQARRKTLHALTKTLSAQGWCQ